MLIFYQLQSNVPFPLVGRPLMTVSYGVIDLSTFKDVGFCEENLKWLLSQPLIRDQKIC